MDAELRGFRKKVRAANRGRTKLARRYSRQLRLDAVAYLKRKKREGMSLERVSSELDVSTWSLLRWSRESESRGEVVPVELSSSAESEELSMVTPRGYRIEGLSEESLIRLVERLG